MYGLLEKLCSIGGVSGREDKVREFIISEIDGFADWRVATALISGFTAKEAVVSTMSVLLNTSVSTLGGALSAMFTPLTAASFLAFTLLYTPCVAAVATIKREMNSTLATIGIVILQCVVAWLVAFGVYQIGSLIV